MLINQIAQQLPGLQNLHQSSSAHGLPGIAAQGFNPLPLVFGQPHAPQDIGLPGMGIAQGFPTLPGFGASQAQPPVAAATAKSDCLLTITQAVALVFDGLSKVVDKLMQLFQSFGPAEASAQPTQFSPAQPGALGQSPTTSAPQAGGPGNVDQVSSKEDKKSGGFKDVVVGILGTGLSIFSGNALAKGIGNIFNKGFSLLKNIF